MQEEPVQPQQGQLVTEKSIEILTKWKELTDYGNGTGVSSSLEAGLVYLHESPGLPKVMLAAVVTSLHQQGLFFNEKQATAADKSIEILNSWQASTSPGLGESISSVLNMGLTYGKEDPGLVKAMQSAAQGVFQEGATKV